MSHEPTAHTRRNVLLTGAAAGATFAVFPPSSAAQAQTGTSNLIRPFRAAIQQAAIDDMRRRVQMTRWPERENVADSSQGVPLARLQPLAHHWGADYNWRKGEARFNAIPQFITEIDGLDIQFAHIRSRHADAMPLLMTHGWPGSIFELMKVIGPLTDPTAHGGRAQDAFHLVLPTYPGYGFSGRPRDTTWAPDRVARAWHTLMMRVGYSRYVSQGGDWGAIISEVMAVQAPKGLMGIHINMPGTVPPDVLRLVRNHDPAPASFTDAERTAFAGLEHFYRKGFGYAEMMNTRSQTIGYSLADSPVGMLGFFYDKFAEWSFTKGQPERAFTQDEILDDVSLYWLTNTGASSSRSYWDAAQGGGGPFNSFDIPTVPVAVTVFPGEIYRAPRAWGEKCFKHLIYWNEVDRGGHFAAWEEPDLFASELRVAFRSLR